MDMNNNLLWESINSHLLSNPSHENKSLISTQDLDIDTDMQHTRQVNMFGLDGYIHYFMVECFHQK
jgi:hypothetical protein